MINALLPNRFNFLIWLQALIMLAGLFFFGWDPFYIVMAYFLETILIGIIHALKMWTVLKFSPEQHRAFQSDPKDSMNHGGIILFFLVHFYFFVAIQSIFVFVFFESKLPQGREPFSIFKNYAWLLSQPEFLMLFAIQAATLVGLTLREWFGMGRFKTYTLKKLFIQPYLRIFIQQFVAILSGFFFIILQQGFAAAILLILLRLAIDTFLISLNQKPESKEKAIRFLIRKKTGNEKDTREQLDAFLD